MTTADISRVSRECLSTLGGLLNKKPESVISINKEGEEWKVIAEVLERRSVPDTQDIIGRYELKLDKAGELLSYKQVMTKRRVDMIIEEE